MKKEYVVTFKASCQISPEDFDVYNPSLKVTSDTTIAEIETFYRKHIKNGTLQVTLIELEIP